MTAFDDRVVAFDELLAGHLVADTRVIAAHDAYERMRGACADGLAATAVIASTDRHALGALAALADAGISVPRQVSVIGFDDYVTSEYIRPALTTMRMPAAEMGVIAVGMLSDRLAGRPVQETTLLTATLVERTSAAKAQAD